MVLSAQLRVAAVRSCVAAMLSSIAGSADARRGARGISPASKTCAVLFVMCAIVACCAALVKSFSKNFCMELVKLLRGAVS